MPSSITGGSVDIKRVSFILSDAEIKALPTASIEVIAAQGANTLIVPFFAVCRLGWVADYGNFHAECMLQFTIGSGGLVLLPFRQSMQSALSGLLAGGGPDGSIGWSVALFLGKVDGAPGAVVTGAVAGLYDSDVVNQPLTLSADNQGDGNFTGGNAGNSLKVTVLYSIMDI